MANEIHIGLNLRGEQPTTRGLKNVGGAAEKAGDGLQDMAKDAGFLDKRIGELRGGLSKLITEFDRTGDKDLLKKIGGEKRELGSLTRLKKQLSDLTEDAAQAGVKAGGAFGGSLLKSASTAMLGGKALFIGGLAVLAVAALPFLGATVAAAVLGGAGIGGIIGGLALAARDSRVKDEAAKLGQHALDAFGRSAEPFIAPAIEAMHLLRGVVDDVAGDMRQAFATIAPVLVPLTQGISGLVDKAMPGFIKAMESAKPIIRALAEELPKIGEAVGDFFATIADDPDGAILAIRTLSNITQDLLRHWGGLIAMLSAVFAWTVRASSVIAPVMETLFGWIPGVGDMIKANRQRVDEMLVGLERAKDGSGDFSGSLQGLADSASEAETQLSALNDATDRFFGRTMDLHQATIRYEQAVDDLSESVKENGKALDERTEKGRANRGAMLDEIQAIKGIRDANIENNMSVADANAVYDKQLEQLRRSAYRLGLNKTEVDALVNAYKNIPALAESEIRIKGLAGAIAKVRQLARLLGSNAAAARALSGDDQGGVYGGGRAGGGPVYPGQTYVVGENGPEVLQMGGTSGHVYSNAQSQAMMSAAPSVQVIEFRFPSGANGLERMFLSWFQGAVRANPGFRLVVA